MDLKDLHFARSYYGRCREQVEYDTVCNVNSLGGVPREQKMLKGHLPRVIYHRVYSNIRRETRQKSWELEPFLGEHAFVLNSGRVADTGGTRASSAATAWAPWNGAHTLHFKPETRNSKPKNIPYALTSRPETRNPKPKNSQGVLFLMSEVPL